MKLIIVTIHWNVKLVAWTSTSELWLWNRHRPSLFIWTFLHITMMTIM